MKQNKKKQVVFITGNKNKLSEVQYVLPDVIGRQYDIPELQEVNADKIIAAKLDHACSLATGPLIVEDTSLYMQCLSSKGGKDGLPGPLIKWFLQSVESKGLVKMAKVMGNAKAQVRCIIGYSDDRGQRQYFTGFMNGTIVEPQGKIGFGWDHIFVPEGSLKTFANMSIEEKNEIGMRGQAVKKLKDFLDGKLV